MQNGQYGKMNHQYLNTRVDTDIADYDCNKYTYKT